MLALVFFNYKILIIAYPLSYHNRYTVSRPIFYESSDYIFIMAL